MSKNEKFSEPGREWRRPLKNEEHLNTLRARFESKRRVGSDFREDELSERPIRVRTGKVEVAGNDKEMFTEAIAGCVGIFIQSEEKNALIHCTPDHGFAHMRPEETSKDIHQELLKAGIDPETAKISIVGTMGHDSGKFSYEEENTRWQALSDQLKERGMANVNVSEVPVMDMTLYFTPERPGELLAMGDKAFYDEDGRYRTQVKDRQEYWVDLDAEEKQEFGIERPSPEEELPKQTKEYKGFTWE